MTVTTPKILSVIVGGLRPVFNEFGLDFLEATRNAGIPAEDLENPDAFIDVAAFSEMLEQAAAKTREPCFGLLCAEKYAATPVSLLGYLISNASTIHEALKTLQRYLRLMVSPIYISYRLDGDLFYLTISYPQDFTAPRTQHDLFTLGILIRRLSVKARPERQIEQLDLVIDDPGCPELCARLLSPNIRFNQPEVVIVFNVETLASRLNTADDHLYSILQQHADNMLLQTPDHADLVDRTRHEIKLLLAKEPVDLEIIAQSLNVSPRTLQMKLAKQNTSFTALVEEVRADLAQYYLQDTKLSITDIAFLLGFSEPSAFTRAASRWLGMTPMSYRRAREQHSPIKLS